MTTTLRLTLLGGFKAEIGSKALSLSKKAQGLLAYLALAPGQAHPRAKLAALLWGDRGEEQARNSLRQALFVIRRPLEASGLGFLVIDAYSVKLDPVAIAVDVTDFRRLAAQGTEAALAEAVRLYGGDLLDGLSVGEAMFESWLTAERIRLHELAVKVFSGLLAEQVEVGTSDAGIETALRLLALDPLQETGYRALMRIHASQGRRGTALRQYQLCADTLWRELRIEPEAETKRIYEKILRQSEQTTNETSVESPSPRGRPAAAEASETSRLTPAPSAPLIGRAVELDRLLAELRQARDGGGRLIAVLGEAGIGKTRLVDALVGEGVRQGFRIVQGRGYESEQILPFGLWVNALRASGVTADQDALEALDPAWRRELGRLFPELRARDRREGPTSENYLRLFEAIVQLVGCLAARGPLLLVLEDLHWADQTSVRLLSFLGRRIAHWPICVAVSAREEDVYAHPLLRPVFDELAREGCLVELPLTPLSRDNTLELVRALAAFAEPGVVAELGARVWQMSEGNPLIVTEAVRSFSESETWTSTGDLPMPERVRRIVEGRIGQGSAVARELLDVASVIGKDFDFNVLQQASGLDERGAAGGVEELVRRRLLHLRGEHVDFTHDRVREAVYTALGSARRRLFHAAVAAALEQRYGDDLEPHSAVLALHHREAHSWDRAAFYLHAASSQAVRRGAYREAKRLLEDSLEALAHLPKGRSASEREIEARLDLRDVLVALADLGPVRAHLEAAQRLVEGLGDDLRWMRVSLKSSHYSWLVGDQDRAIELGQRIIELSQRMGEPAMEAAAHLRIGQAYSVLGQHLRAIEALHQSLEVSKQAETSKQKDAFGLTSALGMFPMIPQIWLATSLAELGRFDEAIPIGESAVTAAETVQQLYTIGYTNLVLGYIYLGRGDLARALPVVERSHALALTWQIGLLGPGSTMALAQVYAALGRHPDAAPLLGSGPIPKRAQASMRHFRRAQALLDVGRTGDALAVAGEAVELAREFKERGDEGHALRLLGDAHARHVPKDAGRAETCYRQALALAEDLGMRPLAAQCRLGLGELGAGVTSLTTSGRILRRPSMPRAPKQAALDAQEHLAVAVREFRALAMPSWLARAEEALAEMAGR